MITSLFPVLEAHIASWCLLTRHIVGLGKRVATNHLSRLLEVTETRFAFLLLLRLVHIIRLETVIVARGIDLFDEAHRTNVTQLGCLGLLRALLFLKGRVVFQLGLDVDDRISALDVRRITERLWMLHLNGLFLADGRRLETAIRDLLFSSCDLGGKNIERHVKIIYFDGIILVFDGGIFNLLRNDVLSQGCGLLADIIVVLEVHANRRHH